METVIQVLEKMGRATYREVAARLDIDPVDALTMLREQRDQGLCDFGDGGWFIGTVTKQPQQSTPKVSMSQAPRLKGEEPEEVDPDVIRQQLRDNGAMTTVSLAAAANRNARGMVSVLRALERQGVVVKNGQGKGVTWSLPASSTEPEPAIHRWRRVTVEPYGPYPWHYGDFIGFSKPVDGIEDEYYYSAPPASGPLVNDVTSGKPLSIKLPDISSKAFWSGTGKNEKFHPETYRRWVKEAIERSCTIARVDVEVK